MGDAHPRNNTLAMGIRRIMPDEMDKLESENPDEAVDQPEGSDKPDYQAKAKAFYGQLKEEKAKRKELEEKVSKLEAKQADTKPVELDAVDEVLKLQSDGYSTAEILKVKELAKTFGKRPSEILGHELVKAGLESIRSKAKAEDAVPAPSSRSALSTGKTLEEVSSDKKLLKENFSEVMAKYKRK